MNAVVVYQANATCAAEPRPYALGYTEREFRRLEFQGEFFRDLTEDILRRAGIAPGMQVLDVGCGVGDVSLLLGRMTGPSGAVLGIDRSQDAIAVARRRAGAGGFDHLRFEASEIDAFSAPQPFDAIVGRLVLGYLPDPAATLKRLAGCLRPGGILAFQEMAMVQARSVPEGPHFASFSRWMLQTFERAGFEVDMGGKLFGTFLAAGLPAPQMISAGRVEGSPQSSVYGYLAEVVRSLLPMMERLGVARPAEVAVDTLTNRLRDEAVANKASIMLPPLIGAWTRVPLTMN